MNTRRKEIRKDRLAILLILCVVVITAVGFRIWKISSTLFHDPYEAYKACKTKGGDYGGIQQVNKEYGNEAFISLTYPVYEGEELNSLVKAYEKKTVPAAGKIKKQTASTDHDSSLSFGRYVNLAFHRHVYNVDGVQMHTETTQVLYDKKQKKQLVPEDVLRRECPALMKRLTREQDWKEDIKRDTSTPSMTKTGLRIHLDKKHIVPTPYKEYRKYIRLKDSHVPSLYQKDTTVVRAQPRVDPKKKMITFTFDGRSSAYTSKVMDIFERCDGRVTFFVLGQNVEANCDIAEEMYNRGFELGNHSQDHSIDLAASKKGYMSVSQITEDIYKVQDAIYAICGAEPQYFRPLYGAVNNNMLKGNHLGYALWDIDTGDQSSKNATNITAVALNEAKNGNIVILFCNTYEPSVESLKSILLELRKQGHQFVTYSILVKYEKNYLSELDAGCNVSEVYASGHQICVLFTGLFSSFVLC